MTRLSDKEIVDRWEAAIDKERELDRLAVACHTDRAAMRERLEGLGLMQAPKPLDAAAAIRERKERSRKPSQPAAPTAPPDGEPRKTEAAAPVEEEPEKAETVRTRVRLERAYCAELYYNGKTDDEIAKALGVSKHTVARWRKERGLAPNRKAKREPFQLAAAEEKRKTDCHVASLLVMTQEGEPGAEDINVPDKNVGETDGALSVGQLHALFQRLLAGGGENTPVTVDGRVIKGVRTEQLWGPQSDYPTEVRVELKC